MGWVREGGRVLGLGVAFRPNDMILHILSLSFAESTMINPCPLQTRLLTLLVSLRNGSFTQIIKRKGGREGERERERERERVCGVTGNKIQESSF